MKKLTLPQLHQTFNYDCGANALQAILVYYGVEAREDQVIKFAKTTKYGTPVQGIISAAKKYGLKTDSRKMTIKDLRKFIDKDIPVIIALQAWTKKKNIDWEKDWTDGHYVVVTGYTKDRIIFEDPSSFLRTYLTYQELEKRWHDVGTDGKKYLHYGIAVFGKKPNFLSKNIIHMD